MSPKNFKFFRLRNLFTFALFFSLFFLVAGIYSSANAQAAPPNTIQDCDLPNFGGVSTVGGSTRNPDVACRCKINECRLSSGGFDLTQQLVPWKYACIQGSPNPSYYLGQDGTFDQFKDSKIYEDMGLIKNLPGSVQQQTDFKGNLFLDIFAMDALQTNIPIGAVCKTHASDPTGVAYWYFPGYFDVLQGISPNRSNANPALGGACPANATILFSSVDLFGRPVTGTQTFFGCLPNSTNGLVAFMARLLTGLSLLVTLVIAGINLIQIIMNATNSDAIAEHQKKMISAIVTFIGILLGITLLSILGIQIIGFGSEGIGGSIFRFFVGG